jgi:hypothetical protein
VSDEFKQLVFKSLSESALTPYHVLLEVQLRSYVNDEFDPVLRTTATLGKVERALESLEQVEGVVERVEGRLVGERLAESSTLRYRAVRETVRRLALCKSLKVRKPWRDNRREETDKNDEEADMLESMIVEREKRKSTPRNKLATSPPSMTRGAYERKSTVDEGGEVGPDGVPKVGELAAAAMEARSEVAAMMEMDTEEGFGGDPIPRKSVEGGEKEEEEIGDSGDDSGEDDMAMDINTTAPISDAMPLTSSGSLEASQRQVEAAVTMPWSSGGGEVSKVETKTTTEQ